MKRAFHVPLEVQLHFLKRKSTIADITEYNMKRAHVTVLEGPFVRAVVTEVWPHSDMDEPAFLIQVWDLDSPIQPEDELTYRKLSFRVTNNFGQMKRWHE